MAKTILTATYLLIISAIHAAAIAPLSPTVPVSIMGAASSPEPADCFTYMANMSDCINFVESGSTLNKPDPACCPELAGLIESQPACLCKMLSNSTQSDMPFDINRALTLPSLCNINTSPDQICAGSKNAAPTILLSKPRFIVGAAIVLFIYIL